MAKGKYETHVLPKLLQVEAWARDGLILEQIAHNLGIHISTLCDYKNRYGEFSEALKRGKEVIDIEVENALLKRALGYRFDEVARESEVNMQTGERELTVTKIVTKEVQPDVTAQIFWLKNRRPETWRDKQSHEHSGPDGKPIPVEARYDLAKLTNEELIQLEEIVRKSSDTGTNTV